MNGGKPFGEVLLSGERYRGWETMRSVFVTGESGFLSSLNIQPHPVSPLSEG